MKTKKWAIAMMILCTVFTTAAQMFYKIGAGSLEFNINSIITNWPIMIGMVFYGIGSILVIIALKHGEVSTLYPIITLSYIWVTLSSKYYFNEEINVFRWIGIFLIIIGITFIAFGEEDKEILKYTESV